MNNAVWLIVMATSYIQFVESNAAFPEKTKNFSFHETAFFIMTSFTFIGYGSYVVTIQGRAFMTIMLVVAFVGIPGQTGILLNLMSSKSIHQRRVYESTENVEHIVLIGHLSNAAMFNFF